MLKNNTMPDITMCVNHKCPLKTDCYRYGAKSTEYSQSYAKFEFETKFDEGIVCDKYMKFPDYGREPLTKINGTPRP